MAENEFIFQKILNQLQIMNNTLYSIDRTMNKQAREADICHNVPDPYEDVEDEWTFECSNCGTSMKIVFETVTMYEHRELPNFCPNCGYKVE